MNPEHRDWLAESATAYDAGDYTKAATAAMIDQGVMMRRLEFKLEQLNGNIEFGVTH